MNIAGIIAEYNPFHNGHAYHIEEVKKRTDAEYIIAIMSGDFVQRGAPAIADKYLRTKMALLGGADLVMELPVCAATATAEVFARTGVSILAQSGVITHLGFGCETDDLSLLTSIAELFAEEPGIYKEALSSYLKEGLSFPAARAKAAEAYFKNSNDGIAPAGIHDILNTPNNILAIEYLKALKHLNSSIKPCAIQRKGAEYHSTDCIEGFSSATAIRELLTSVSKASPQTPETGAGKFSQQMPPACADAFLFWLNKYAPVTEDDFSGLLHYKLLLDEANFSYDGRNNLLTDRPSCYEESQALTNRISNLLEQYTSFSDFIQLLKTKDRTYTSISRHLLHILLDIRTDHMEALRQTNYAPYIRILGFKRSSSSLLAELKKSTIPVIMRLAEDAAYLTPAQKLLLETDIRSSHIYSSVLTEKTGRIIKNEYRHPLVYL